MRKKSILFTLLFGILFIQVSGVNAQESSGIRVNGFRTNLDNEFSTDGILRFGDTLYLKVDNLDQLLGQAKGIEKIALYLDENAVTGVRAKRIGQDDVLRFDLNRKDFTQAVRRDLAQNSERYFTTDIAITVGIEGKDLYETDVISARLELFGSAWYKLVLAGVVLLFGLFCILAGRSDIIRDDGIEPENERKKFSLGRTQMALWFFLILFSMPYIWLVTGEIVEISGTLLGLMGISATTGLAAASVDSTKRTDSKNALTKIQATRQYSKTRISEIKTLLLAPTLDVAEKNVLLTELDNKNTTLLILDKEERELGKPDIASKSQGFFIDLVADGNGVSMHRFQVVGWTFILGMMFAMHVVSDKGLVEFDKSLLVVMGISSGTYVGFKLPEKKPDTV